MALYECCSNRFHGVRVESECCGARADAENGRQLRALVVERVHYEASAPCKLRGTCEEIFHNAAISLHTLEIKYYYTVYRNTVH